MALNMAGIQRDVCVYGLGGREEGEGRWKSKRRKKEERREKGNKNKELADTWIDNTYNLLTQSPVYVSTTHLV